jgi:hypothetical protein
VAFLATLDDQKIATLNLCHHMAKYVMDQRVERWIADKIVGYMNEETLMRADGRRKSMEDVGKCRESTMSEFVT